MSVNGDDFTSTGPKCNLDWFEDKLEAKCGLKKGGRLGPGLSDLKELTILDRVGACWKDSVSIVGASRLRPQASSC